MAQHLNRTHALANLPSEYPHALLAQIQTQVKSSGRKIVVLDDDPTGTQTVHDIPVLTEWSFASLRAEFANDLPCFYILTNSRSLPPNQAQALNVEIGRNVLAASRETGRDFSIISRSDSTLRGHFPGEVQALAQTLEQEFDGWLIVPFFLEGGRFTINDVHYVAEGDTLVPASETEFARDAVFGYRSSNLRAWIAEKTQGRVSADQVASVSLDDIRSGGPERVTERLLALTDGRVCIVNAVTMRDLEVFVLGLLAAEARGKRFLYRTAASFVQTRIGQTARALLTADDLALPSSGGALIIVGSYVPKTTRQLAALPASPAIERVEVDVTALLDIDRRAREIERVVESAACALGQNRDVVIYTSRQLVTGASAAQNLEIGQQVSASLVAMVRALSIRPRYVLAKGGITSSDIATRGLDVKRAMVRGQILPGVPVWQLEAGRYPGLTYIVFPGNVGGEHALVEIVSKLKKENSWNASE
ncbi:MAG: hypothetical protein FJ009_07165 [Chloroflexi bacterium]|nr:hypothetical protein [Chloroflexota bacterium]